MAYEEFKWQVAHSSHEPNNPQALQCLFIQINLEKNEYGGSELKLIQIFSKQATLMANLINHFTSELPARDVPDSGSFREDQFVGTRAVERNAINKLDKISCATFNAKGECIKQQGSFRFVN